MTSLIFVTLMNCQPTALVGFDLGINKTNKVAISKASKICKRKYNACLESMEQLTKIKYKIRCGGDLTPQRK